MNSLFFHLALFPIILICFVSVTNAGNRTDGEGSSKSGEKLPKDKNPFMQMITTKIFTKHSKAKGKQEASNEKDEKTQSNERDDKKPSNSHLNGMKEMFESGIFADVLFSFGKDKEQKFLPAHKSVLCVFSDEFRDMFLGVDKLADQQNKSGEQKMSREIVEITDVNADVFKLMLQFIYYEDLDGLNKNNLLQVLNAAKTYKVAGLIEACIAFPLDTFPNIFLIYNAAQENKPFADRCLAYIDRNAEQLIHSDAFLQIKYDLLIELLGRDQLEVNDEMSIWKATLRWADFKCKQKGLDLKNNRKVGKEALNNIRFAFISLQDCNEIISSAALLEKDILILSNYFVDPQNSVPNDGEEGPTLNFSTKPRNYIKKGKIEFIVKQFSDFEHAPEWTQRLSNAMNAWGVEWKISFQKLKDSFGFYLRAASIDGKDTNWAKECKVTLRIIAQKEGKKDRIEEFQRTYNSAKNSLGYKKFTTFQELTNVDNGWYNRAEDSVHLVAEFIVIDPK